MPIEFPTGPPREGDMTVEVKDADGVTTILDASQDCDVKITWEIPPPHNLMLGGEFYLKAYVESLGPGQEMQVGPTNTVAVDNTKTIYQEKITVSGATLKGEGELYNAEPVSGVYKIIAVLQHKNASGDPTPLSGFAEVGIRMFRTP